MRVLLIHGMARTPLAMAPLAWRLRRRGLETASFGYAVTFETWNGCLRRLRRRIDEQLGTETYLIVGHSLGTVLTRAVLPELRRPPEACVFLAPPTCACRAARRLASWPLYRGLTGEMGQLLANTDFMAGLPIPAMPTRVYAGTGGPTGRFSPFGNEPNDGILAVSETNLAGIPTRRVPAIHSFIMNRPEIAQDIAALAAAEPDDPAGR